MTNDELRTLLATLKEFGVTKFLHDDLLLELAPPPPPPPQQVQKLVNARGEEEDPDKMVDTNERMLRTLLAATPFGNKR